MTNGFLKLGRICRKYLGNRDLLEKGNAENLQDFVQVQMEWQLFLQDGYQHVDRDGSPDLGLHGTGRSAIECLDPQVLFDPLEEEFHFPATVVELGDREGGQGKVVREKDEVRPIFGVEESDATQWRRIEPRRFRPPKDDGLIAAQSRGFVDAAGCMSGIVEIVFGASDEEGHVLGEAIQSRKVDVGAIHDVERTGFDKQFVEGAQIVRLCVCNVDKTRNAAMQVEEGVQLDGALAFAKARPRKEGEAEVDGSGVEHVSHVLEFDPEVVVSVELTSGSNQNLSEVGKDAPISFLVGIGQCASRDVASDARMIELGLHRSKASGDVAQTLSIGELGEGHAVKLVEARERTYPAIASVSLNTLVELVLWEEIHQLGEHDSSDVHWPFLSGNRGRKFGQSVSCD